MSRGFGGFAAAVYFDMRLPCTLTCGGIPFFRFFYARLPVRVEVPRGTTAPPTHTPGVGRAATTTVAHSEANGSGEGSLCASLVTPLGTPTKKNSILTP